MKEDIVLSNRKKIVDLETFLLENADGKNIQGTGKEVLHSKDFPLKHTFVDGVYVREMKFKKDSAVVGAIHKHLHVWFLLYGHLFIATEDFQEEYKAPCYVVAKPGSKRIIYAAEDSLFVNIHANPENIRDIEELEKRLVSLNYEDYEQYIKNK
tara:strand:+ start:233 stop:694 length:462 start_codon:yes stop_codon:yes gene_type:complete